MNIFEFDPKIANVIQLRNEIESSTITIAVSSVQVTGTKVTVIFKADLSETEIAELNSIVDFHDPIFEVEEIQKVVLHSPSTSIDIGDDSDFGIPYVYATSRPLNHFVCFQGAGDKGGKIGGGNKCIFRLNSKTQTVSKDFSFDEDVFLKDGYIITKDAPMGATIDVDIVEPTYGMIVACFARKAPLYGTGWFPLDTEDRGMLPQGFIIRISINNSNGGEEGCLDEDYPADFFVSGRFELYRKRWPDGVFNR